MNPIDLAGANFCTASGLLTATGAETVHDTTVVISYCVNGISYRKTAITNGATPTTDGVTGSTFTALTANQGCVMLWCLNSAGTVKVVQSEIQALDSSGNFIIASEWPLVPDAMTPFAYQVIKAGATAGTIAFGTSNWNATGFTNVIKNLMVLPNRPQVS